MQTLRVFALGFLAIGYYINGICKRVPEGTPSGHTCALQGEFAPLVFSLGNPVHPIRQDRWWLRQRKEWVFLPNKKKLQPYSEAMPKPRAMQNRLKYIQEILGAPSALSEQPSPDNLKYPGFSVEAYEKAVENYARTGGWKRPYRSRHPTIRL